jgi:hydrogenase nickel incorporation protein HypA/HybF
MHEMALAASLIALVADEVKAAGASRATRIHLDIGALSHVEPQALRFAFDAAAAGSVAEGAALEIDEPPGRAYCLDCSAEVAIDRRGDACPACGGYKLMVQQGDGMRLSAMEVV